MQQNAYVVNGELLVLSSSSAPPCPQRAERRRELLVLARSLISKRLSHRLDQS